MRAYTQKAALRIIQNHDVSATSPVWPYTFGPFSGRSGPVSLDEPKLFKVRRRLGSELVFDIKQETNSVIVYILRYKLVVNYTTNLIQGYLYMWLTL